MREIKFRAWDKRRKEFTDALVSSLGRISEQLNDGRYELMQYTGLKDKNDREIYEGDIVIGALVDNKPCQVVYRPPTYMLGYPYYNDPTMRMVRPLPDRKHREVIGNIYENPELLEEIEGVE